MKLLIAVIVLSSACAPLSPVKYDYQTLNFSLVCASEDAINNKARAEGLKHTDKGNYYPTVTTWKDKDGFTHIDPIRVPAFFNEVTREIWIRAGEWCDILAHELCHADGHPAAFCEDNYPRK